MAAVMRCSLQSIARRFLHSSLHNPRYVQKNVVSCFYTSSFLNVKGHEINMPSLSPTMSEGTIVKWLKKEGDKIAPGDVICEIQTDKAVIAMEVDEEGILAKILVPDNTKEVPVGTLIALMVDQGEDWKSVEIPPPRPPVAKEQATATPAAPAAAAAAAAPVAAPAAVPVSHEGFPELDSKTAVTVFTGASFYTATLKSFGPSVRNLLMKYDIKPDAITPTGNRNKILKSDILKYIETNKVPERRQVPAPAPGAPAGAAAPKGKKAPTAASGASFVDLQISGIRQTIAKRLLASKTTIPHSYASTTCNITKLVNLRKKLKEDGIAVSVNDFVIRAAALALAQCREVNAHWVKDKAVSAKEIDISVAVSTPTGLITPIVKDAISKGIVEVSKSVRDLAQKARAGKLQPQEFQGGTFTISNLGMYGIKEFSAIINPPQVAILAVGGGLQILAEDKKAQTNMSVCLSFDRRAFDEQLASEFLRAFQRTIENPSSSGVLGRLSGQSLEF